MTQVLQYLQGGGVVMVPIVVLSVWMWVLVIQGGLGLMKGGDVGVEEARDYLDGRRPLPQGGPVGLFLERLKVMGSRGPREAKAVLKVVGLEIVSPLRTVKALASVAPLLGLLGTVLGMVSTFWTLSVHGTGSPKALAAGVSEALITTVSGLLVSIPGLFAHGLLYRRAERAMRDLEELAARLMATRRT